MIFILLGPRFDLLVLSSILSPFFWELKIRLQCQGSDATGQDPELLLEKPVILLASGNVFHSYESVIFVAHFNLHSVVNCNDHTDRKSVV